MNTWYTYTTRVLKKVWIFINTWCFNMKKIINDLLFFIFVYLNPVARKKRKETYIYRWVHTYIHYAYKCIHSWMHLNKLLVHTYKYEYLHIYIFIISYMHEYILHACHDYMHKTKSLMNFLVINRQYVVNKFTMVLMTLKFLRMNMPMINKE